MHLLIIEDNADIVANLYGYFEPQGYVLDIARSGTSGLSHALKQSYDAIILDLTLPGIDGFDVCKRLRHEHRIATPILMLTARDTVQDKLFGFDVGADDYLVKPFSLLELGARLKALVRRARHEQVDTILQWGDVSLNTETRQVSRASSVLEVTPTGYILLTALLRQAPAIVSREVLEREVWGDDPPSSDALRTHIHALRQAVDKPFVVPLIKTVAGVGYRLADPDES